MFCFTEFRSRGEFKRLPHIQQWKLALISLDDPFRGFIGPLMSNELRK